MKKASIFVCTMVLLLVFLCVPGWGAPRYLGESTWTITITMDEDGQVSGSNTGTVKMAITQMGGSYYTVQGYLEMPDDGPFILSGGGVLIGDTFYFTVTGSQKHTDSDWRDTDIMQIQMNKDTLNGTFYSVGHDFDESSAGASPDFDTRFTSGTLTLAGSPIVFATNLTAPMTLLLND